MRMTFFLLLVSAISAGCGKETSGSTTGDAGAEMNQLMCEGAAAGIVVPDGCPTTCESNDVGAPARLQGQSCSALAQTCPSLLRCVDGTFWVDCACTANGLLNEWNCDTVSECGGGPGFDAGLLRPEGGA